MHNLHEFLSVSIARFSETLELSSLESFIVTGDFFNDVTEYQTTNQLRERGATNTEHEQAIAKVLSRRDENGNLKQTVFFADYIAQGFFSDLSTSAYHFMHHELCHVHENFLSDRIYSPRGKRGDELPALKHLLYVHAEIIWSEYYVERLSVLTLDVDNVRTTVDHLFQVLDRIKQEIDTEIMAYRTHADIDMLFTSTQQKTSILLKVAATLWGILHGFKQITKENFDEVYGMIEDRISPYKYFIDCWHLLDVALNHLYEKYPNWNDVYEFDELGNAILNCWNGLGFYPEDTEQGLYIGVP